MKNSNLKKIDALIRSIGTRGTTLRETIQSAACLIVAHAKESNDCSRALTLCAAVAFASDRVKLIQWFGMVSPINVTFTADPAKRKVRLRQVGSPAYVAFNVEKAKALNYWTVGKSDDELTEAMTTAEVNSMILRLAKRIRKELAERHAASGNDNSAITAKLAALEAVTTVISNDKLVKARAKKTAAKRAPRKVAEKLAVAG